MFRLQLACQPFQFTPLHERQHTPKADGQEETEFQFTPLHERQPRFGFIITDQKLFQFTPLHERQRGFTRQEHGTRIISIHAST